jgi:hypothetical protein
MVLILKTLESALKAIAYRQVVVPLSQCHLATWRIATQHLPHGLVSWEFMGWNYDSWEAYDV